MTISWDDLRKLKAYRVISPRGVDGVMIAHVDDSSVPHYVSWGDERIGWIKSGGEIYSGPDELKDATILGELKLPQDMTAEDLDGCIIKTKDEGEVLFADGHARLYNKPGNENLGTWRSPCPVWMDGETAEENRIEYLAYVEQQKNPIEIMWQGECRDDDGTLYHAHAKVRGDLWRISRCDGGDFFLYLGKIWEKSSLRMEEVEHHIRNHYKTKK